MSLASIGSSQSDVLALLRQHFLGSSSAAAINSSLDPNAADGISGAGTSAAAGASAAAPSLTGSGVSPIDSNTLAILITIQEQPAATATPSGTADAAQQLFNSIDANGDGQISEPELESAVTAAGGTTSQADALFGALDPSGSGSISESELSQALQQGPGPAHGHGHHHHHAGAADQSNPDPLAALFGDASGTGTSQTASNPDGSSTTTISYPDGTTFTLTIPAGASGGEATANAAASGSAANGNSAGPAQPTQSAGESLLTTLIRLQEQAFQTSDPSSQAATLAA